MNKNSNKLISLLVTLDRPQRKKCGLLLQSPYFNRSPDLYDLFLELSRRLEKDLSIEKTAIWKGVWGKRKYNDVRFRKYCSDLLKLVEEFAIQEELEGSAMVKDRLRLAAMNRLKASKQLEGIMRNWESSMAQIAEELPENGEKYLTLFQLERQYFEIARFDSRTQDRSNLEEIMRNLDIFYISEKLYAYNSANSTAFARYHKYKIDLIEPIVEFLRNNPDLLSQPTIATQYYNYLIELEPEEEEHYFAFKDLLFQLSDDTNSINLQHLYQTALNYSSRKINAGDPAYMREYLDVYRHGLAQEAVFENGALPPQHFKNSIATALRLGDFDWAWEYIQNYKDRIPKEYRDNAVNLNLATFYFYQKDYNKAMDYLRDVEYEDVTYNLNAKSMLLAIYYETDEFDALDSLFDAILAYLSRHKEIPANYKKYFRNLVSVTRKMTRIIPGDKKAVEKLSKEVESTKEIASLNWVKEKLVELA